MEQLDKKSQIGEVAVSKAMRKKVAKSYRVVLEEGILKKVEAWQRQIHEKFNGMVKLNKTDLVNVVLGDLPNSLTPKVLKTLQEQKLDDVTKAKWVLLKLQDAQKSGENLNFDDLIKEAQRTINSPPRKTKSKSASKKVQETSLDDPSKEEK